MKSNRRGEPDVPCRQQEKPEKEGASSLIAINDDLNLEKPISTPSFQSQNDAINDNTINPINLECTSKDSDLHEDSQHGDAVLDDTVDSMECNKAHVGLSPTSLDNKALFVRPGLVSEATAKWVRITRPISSYIEVAHNAQLGKCHVKAYSIEHPKAKRRSQQNVVSQPLSFSMVEVAQQPRRIQ